jgi:hypothetical protein
MNGLGAMNVLVHVASIEKLLVFHQTLSFSLSFWLNFAQMNAIKLALTLLIYTPIWPWEKVSIYTSLSATNESNSHISL